MYRVVEPASLSGGDARMCRRCDGCISCRVKGRLSLTLEIVLASIDGSRVGFLSECCLII